jgi:hypothetical protein
MISPYVTWMPVEATAIIVRATTCPIAEVLLTLYTTYHSPPSDLLLFWFYHTDLVKLIEVFYWMKPLIKYSFPLRLPELSLFPSVAARLRFRILVQAIQETPEHSTPEHNIVLFEKAIHRPHK